MTTLAPIGLFVYNRLEVLKTTIAALEANALASQSDLFIFSDGPKKAGDPKVGAVRDYLKSIKGFKSVSIIESPENKGLSNSIIDGVTTLIDRFGKVIVLEDDLMTSPHFLKYMNDSLALYEHDDAVACIHGYNYPNAICKDKTFFLKGADCWGWGTWKRAWDLFEKDGAKLLDQIQNGNLESEFTFKGTYPYLDMLRNQIAGKNDSWAIRWYASAFIKNKLCLYPSRTLVANEGFGEDATNCTTESGFHASEIDTETSEFPRVNPVENTEMREKFEEVFSSWTKRVSGNFFLRREKYLNKRTITILGFIKIKYTK